MSKYLKYRLPIIVACVLIEAILFLFFFLYDLNMLPLGHFSLILLAALVISGLYDYTKFKNKHRLISEGYLDMVTPENVIEQDYMEQIKKLQAEKRIIRDKAGSDFNDMIEYYTVWAHQIKTPIAALSLTVQNIEDDSLRQTLQSELVRTEEYADMVMGYLRLRDDSNDFVFEKTEISDIVRAEIRRMRTLFLSKKIMVDYDGSKATVLTDKRWLGFCLGQVLTNSIKYSSGGTITIRVTNDEIVIKDEGIGISEEDLPRIFEKGYTGYNGRSDKKSTGIGLYLVKKAMNSIGGDIVVESQSGVGTKARLIYHK